MKQVLFRAEGNSQIGLGHLSRLTSIADYLSGTYKRVLIINQVSTENKDIINHHFDEIVELKMDPKDLFKEKELQKILSLEGTFVADGYDFNSEYQKAIHDSGKRMVFVDDLANISYHTEVVVNHAAGINSRQYTKANHTQLCLGFDYLMLRKEFIVRTPNWNENNNEILISFGGADPNNYTQVTLDLLSEIQDRPIHVIIGPANKHPYSSLAGNVTLHHSLSAEKIIERISSSALAITSASTMSYEVCRIGCPLLIVLTAANQKFLAKGLTEHGCAAELYLDKKQEWRTIIFKYLNNSAAHELVNAQKKHFSKDPSISFQRLIEPNR